MFQFIKKKGANVIFESNMSPYVMNEPQVTVT